MKIKIFSILFIFIITIVILIIYSNEKSNIFQISNCEDSKGYAIVETLKIIDKKNNILNYNKCEFPSNTTCQDLKFAKNIKIIEEKNQYNLCKIIK